MHLKDRARICSVPPNAVPRDPPLWYVFDGTFVVPEKPSPQNILWEMVQFRSILEFVVQLATESSFHSVVEDLPCVRHWARALLLSQ